MLKAHARDLQKFNEQQLDGLRESMAKHRDDAMRRYQAEMAQFRDEQLRDFEAHVRWLRRRGRTRRTRIWGTGRTLPGGRGSMRDCRRIRTEVQGRARRVKAFLLSPLLRSRRRAGSWFRGSTRAARRRHGGGRPAVGSRGPAPRRSRRNKQRSRPPIGGRAVAGYPRQVLD